MDAEPSLKKCFFTYSVNRPPRGRILVFAQLGGFSNKFFNVEIHRVSSIRHDDSRTKRQVWHPWLFVIGIQNADHIGDHSGGVVDLNPQTGDTGVTFANFKKVSSNPYASARFLIFKRRPKAKALSGA